MYSSVLSVLYLYNSRALRDEVPYTGRDKNSHFVFDAATCPCSAPPLLTPLALSRNNSVGKLHPSYTDVVQLLRDSGLFSSSMVVVSTR